MSLKHGKLSMLCSMALLAGTLSISPAAYGGAYYSHENGYSLTYPNDWEQVPEDVLRAALTLVMNQQAGSKIHFECAFQHVSAVRPLDYPYVFVQILDYQSFGLSGPPNRRQMTQAVRQLSGMDPEETLKAGISDYIKDSVRDLHTQQPQLDVDKKIYLWEVSMQVEQVGLVKGMSYGHFGDEALIQVIFYAVADEWDQCGDDRDVILNSFAFGSTPAFELQAEFAPVGASPASSFSSGLISTGLVIVLGLLAALVTAGIAIPIVIIKLRQPAPRQSTCRPPMT